MLFVFILLGILFFITALLIVPMQFGVHHVRTATKNQFYIYVSLFGILIRIPIHTKSKTRKTPKKAQSPEKSPLSFEVFRANVDAFKDLVSVSKNELIEMLAYVQKHLSCKEMDMRIAFGTGNAATTGITNGAVWTSGTLLLKLIDTLISIKKIHMDVYPDFQHKRFEVSFKTIFIMRPIHFVFIYNHVSNTIKYIKNKISNLK